jgi:hypothetical protein
MPCNTIHRTSPTNRTARHLCTTLPRCTRRAAPQRFPPPTQRLSAACSPLRSTHQAPACPQGAGTVPRLILEHATTPPRICGWEHDEELLTAANMCMGVGELLEHPAVTLTVGDALDGRATVRAGFAGLVVDLTDPFGVLPALTKVRGAVACPQVPSMFA